MANDEMNRAYQKDMQESYVLREALDKLRAAEPVVQRRHPRKVELLHELAKVLELEVAHIVAVWD